MRPSIVLLDAETLGNDLDLTPLRALGDVTTYHTTMPDERNNRIGNADIVITNKVVIDEATMMRAPKLKLICVAATGMNNIDLAAAEKLGIAVRNVKGYSTHSVAQHTFAMLFYLLERMEYYAQVTKDGRWSASGLFTDVTHPYHELGALKWGIIGMGEIGQAVAKLADAFGATVAYHSVSGLNLDQPYLHQPLDVLLETSDIISVHAPLTDKTYNLIDETNLPLLKDKAILLNLGRGGIVNETDLAFELDRREIYAGLDVIETEPIEPTNPLLHIEHPERLLLTPHMAWTSIEARRKLLEGIVANIKRFLAEVV